MSNRLTRLFWTLWRRLRNRDDFNWPTYTKIYSEALDQDHSAGTTLILRDSQYSIKQGKLDLKPGVPPLHPNHKLIYEAVLLLQPSSVMEVGFGGGYHLVNLAHLLPNADIRGCDLLESQLVLATSRYPDLTARATLFVHDVTKSPPPVKVDLVFTQTVVMHIQRDKRHLAGLRNIFQASRKYVVLMENWTSHNFVSDIRQISREESFPWDALYMYFIDDGKQQILVVLANTTIEGLQPLTDNSELLKYL
jgi:trans-aconitate methyltransferase